MIGRYVVARTRSAGVHVGVLRRRGYGEVVLAEARRIWRWKGRNTLHEIALRGVGEGSRVSDAVQEILVAEVIELLPCSPKAELSLRSAKWSA
jgi:hypothetical protein